MTSAFAFTNTEAGGVITSQKLSVVTNYTKTGDEPTEATYNNRTCPVDQSEVIKYRCEDIPQVNTVQQILYPAKVLNGVSFGVRLDEVLRTKDDNGVIICDEPIVATLTIKCPKSSNMTYEVINTVFNRLVGSLYDETTKKMRWNDLIRSGLTPVEN